MKYKCTCGYEGYCYGTPYNGGVSAPWCPKCQMNNGLIKVVAGTALWIKVHDFYKDSCRKKFKDAHKKLLEMGMEECEADEFLEELYDAVSAEYGE